MFFPLWSFPFSLREEAIETNNPRTKNALPELRERERERKRDLLNEEEKRNAIHYSIVEKKKSDTSSFPILLLKLLCRRRYPHQRGVSLRKTKINRSNHISLLPRRRRKRKRKREKEREKTKEETIKTLLTILMCVCVCVLRVVFITLPALKCATANFLSLSKKSSLPKKKVKYFCI